MAAEEGCASCQSMMQELQQLRAEKEAWIVEKLSMQKEIDRRQLEIDMRSREKKSLKETVKQAHEYKQKWTSERAELEAERETLRHLETITMKELEELRTRTVEEQEKYADTEKCLENLKSSVSKLTGELKRLEARRRSLPSMNGPATAFAMLEASLEAAGGWRRASSPGGDVSDTSDSPRRSRSRSPFRNASPRALGGCSSPRQFHANAYYPRDLAAAPGSSMAAAAAAGAARAASPSSKAKDGAGAGAVGALSLPPAALASGLCAVPENRPEGPLEAVPEDVEELGSPHEHEPGPGPAAPAPPLPA
eukprot:tig00000601_g2301.t1